MTEYAVETQGLTKIYGDKAAVDHVDLRVKSGSIYGFIGRNGAGKSTTLKMISGLVHPSQGDIRVFGKPVSGETARRRLGILIEAPGLYPNLSARENMLLKAKCMGLVKDGGVDEAMELMGIADTGKKKVKSFSMGMKQRLGIAMALLGNPDLLVLDEPINGLDPEGIREIRESLRRLNEEQGKTILISSHILGELSKLASDYGIIKDGELIRQMSKEELEEMCRDFLLLEVDNADRAAALLSETIPETEYEVYDRKTLHIYGFMDTGTVNTLMVEHGITVTGCSVHSMDLENYFLNLMDGGERHA